MAFEALFHTLTFTEMWRFVTGHTLLPVLVAVVLLLPVAEVVMVLLVVMARSCWNRRAVFVLSFTL